MYGEQEMKVTIKRIDVLGILKENKSKHKTIVEEARKGYLEKASTALSRRLQEIADGKVVSLHFSLTPPVDHTREYSTAIRMMELHSEDTVVLTRSQFENFIEDRWVWKSEFLAVNSAYSSSAAQQVQKGDPEDVYE